MDFTTGSQSSPAQDQALQLENVTDLSQTEAPFVKKYDDSLIETVLEFAESNSLTEASRRFNIPHSTIYTWQKKSARPQPKKIHGQAASARAGQSITCRVTLVRGSMGHTMTVATSPVFPPWSRICI